MGTPANWAVRTRTDARTKIWSDCTLQSKWDVCGTIYAITGDETSGDLVEANRCYSMGGAKSFRTDNGEGVVGGITNVYESPRTIRTRPVILNSIRNVTCSAISPNLRPEVSFWEGVHWFHPRTLCSR